MSLGGIKIKFSRGVKSSLLTFETKPNWDLFLASFLTLSYYVMNFLNLDGVKMGNLWENKFLARKKHSNLLKKLFLNGKDFNKLVNKSNQ